MHSVLGATTMENLFQKRQELHNLWAERTRIAFSRYERAKQTSYAAYHLCIDAPSADRNLALRRALGDENAARAEFTRTLTIFRELLLEGKVPDEADPAASPPSYQPPRT
jgi:hypothetical protein